METDDTKELLDLVFDGIPYSFEMYPDPNSFEPHVKVLIDGKTIKLGGVSNTCSELMKYHGSAIRADFMRMITEVINEQVDLKVLRRKLKLKNYDTNINS